MGDGIMVVMDYWIGLRVPRAAGSTQLAIHVRTLDPGLTSMPLPTPHVADLNAMPQHPRR